jgi:hypothetical protein
VADDHRKTAASIASVGIRGKCEHRWLIWGLLAAEVSRIARSVAAMRGRRRACGPGRRSAKEE